MAAPSPEEDVKQTKQKQEKEDDFENLIELSEEDQKLKEDLEKLVETLQAPATANESLENLKSTIQTSTSSMSQVPKPLKFLMPMFDTIKSVYDGAEGEFKGAVAELMSVLALINGEDGQKEVLKYRLATLEHGKALNLQDWGHEYVAHLISDLLEVWKDSETVDSQLQQDSQQIITEILNYFVDIGRTQDACDLLIEVQQVGSIIEHVNESNIQKITLYLFSASHYLHPPENTNLLDICFQIFMNQNKPLEALRIAIVLDDSEKVKQIFLANEEVLLRKQLAYYLTWCQYPMPFDEDEMEEMFENEDDEDLFEDMEGILSNKHMSSTYLYLAKDLEVEEAKTPEDVYKEHLIDIKSSNNSESAISASKNLASTYVNAFVNCGFLNDKLMTLKENQDSSGSWIYQNKSKGQLASAASLGLIHFWSADGINKCEPYATNTSNSSIQAGGILGQGISAAGYDDNVSFELLKTHLDSTNAEIRISTILAIGLGHAGKGQGELGEELREALEPFLDIGQPIIIRAMAALSLGIIFIGSQDESVLVSLFQMFEEITEKDPTELETDHHSLYYVLAMGLLFFRAEEENEVALDLMGVFSETAPKFHRAIQVMIEACGFAGTGNVLKIQKLLSIIGEHPEEPEKKKDDEEEEQPQEEESDEEKQKKEVSWHQSLAVLGIALISMGEKYGTQMVPRIMNHFIQYGEPAVRAAVPLCVSLAFVSNPEMEIIDLLSKLSHDADITVVNGAILGLGLISAGTNNARIAGMLRNLLQYHQKSPEQLFLVRLAFGFLHMGKGLVTLNPMHSEKMLVSKAGVAGLTSFLVSCIDIKNNILADKHFLLYCLSLAIRPRMLTILDENCEPMNLDVRVGTAVDTVATVGNQKGITAFQTHQTPVILNVNDRAEFSIPEKWISQTPILEGFVIVRQNPEYEEEK